MTQDLIHDESLHLKPYRDAAGKLTNGVRQTLDAKAITEQEALYLLNNDIQRVENELMTVPNFTHLSGPPQRVLTQMTFNLG